MEDFKPVARVTVEAPQPGVYRDIDFDEYASWDALNASTIGEFVKSAQHGAYYLEQSHDDDPPTASMLFGTALHAAYLEPDRFRESSIQPMTDPTPTKTNPDPEPKPLLADNCLWKTHAAAMEDYPGMMLLHEKWPERIEAISNAINNHPAASALFNRIEGNNELTLIWHIELTINGKLVRIPCKCRVDRHVPSFTPYEGSPKRSAIVDIKTTRDSSHTAFERAIATYGYHRQAAWYLRGALAHNLIGDLHDYSYIIVACEKAPPYPVATYPIAPAAIHQGLAECLTGLRRYVKYRMTGDAPGANRTLAPISMPVWSMNPENEEAEEL